MRNRYLRHLVVYVCEDGTILPDEETTFARFGEKDVYDVQDSEWLSMDKIPDESKDYLIEAYDYFVELIREKGEEDNDE